MPLMSISSRAHLPREELLNCGGVGSVKLEFQTEFSRPERGEFLLVTSASMASHLCSGVALSYWRYVRRCPTSAEADF